MLFFFVPAINGQILPVDRQFEWHKAGINDEFKSLGPVVNVLTLGVKNDGSSPVDNLIKEAIDSYNNESLTLFFPEGVYLFHSPLILNDSIIIEGEGAANTFFSFDLGGKDHLIQATGTASPLTSLSADAQIGIHSISVEDASSLSPGDFIRIFQDDEALIVSDWAKQSTGQILEVIEVASGTIFLRDKLRMTYEVSLQAKIEKIDPVKNVGIKCLTIRRLDESVGQTSNIRFKYAANCLIQGIASEFSNFSHVDLSFSTHIQITGSYFYNAFNFGGGGKGYGVVTQFSTGNCLIQNNIFDKLRHSMLLQAGANGNVFGYNYSINPFWEENFSPSDAAGDIVLHGNYPFANLFEGNIVQNIVIDNSHDINGPNNTFFRNRAELYGIIMLPSPASDKQNFIGNDVSNLQNDLGFFITFGNDHYTFGNLVKNEIIPENTRNLEDSSYYLTSKPSFFGHFPWPVIGTPLASSFYPNPAHQRYQIGEMVTCENEVPIITNIKSQAKHSQTVYPNPNQGEFIWYRGNEDKATTQLVLTDMKGNTIFVSETIESRHAIKIPKPIPGVYLLTTTTKDLKVSFSKVVVQF